MGSMEDEYGRLPEGFKKPRVPLFYTLNWNGNFLDELIHLRYSVSAAEQAQGKYMYSVFTGQNIEAGPVYAYFDVMYSRGKLDPLGLLTELTQPEVAGEEEPGTTGSYAKHRLSFAGGRNTISFSSQMATIRERNV